ncbi:APC family permease [Fructilactobacillus florum]|uniref:Amino acid permease family protein n=1 Tax=Fructilactobacillus florum DSM 22689 = JCM 16035 TaxID=1423745 RepID=A0A0R2CHM5_9LACO|nr:amino acid permease [Fructilactobacillus florum]EKK20734.1 Amino acid permease [Fructilactobacillus florum 2F]KRM91166.1 amino acid permease family protein [Fructilactobacillus florum DSM 22689 = JCM 16035]
MADKTMQPHIGPFTALATVMGTVIGGGVFFKTAAVVAATNSAGLTILAWVLGGLLTICGGLTVSELSAAFPETGGSIKYLEHTYGKITGFLLGWSEMLIYFPANIAALAIIFATQVINLFHLNPGLLVPIALLTAASITIINLFGARAGGMVQSLTFLGKLIPLAIIIIGGLWMPGHVETSLFPLNPAGHTNFITAFSGGLIATMFAYEGWINVGTIAGEIKNPQKNLPRVIGLGLALIMVIYLLVNWVFLKQLPLNQIAGNENTAFEAAQRLFGEFGGKLVTIGILVSVYGTINGYTLTGPRVTYAMAKNDDLPGSHWLKKLSKKYAAPYWATILTFSIATIMVFLGSFDVLTDMLVFVMWIFNCLLFFAVLLLRKREPGLPRPYRVPWFPLIPIIALVGGLFILITTIINQPLLALTGIGVTFAGIPFFYIHKLRH